MSREVLNSKFEIMDTTLREGNQDPSWNSEKEGFNVDEALLIVDSLALFGVRRIEIFHPSVGGKQREIAEAVLDRTRDLNEKGIDITAHAHVRCLEEEIQTALDFGFKAINVYMGTSPQSIRFNHRKELNYVKDIATRTLSDVRKDNPGIYIRFGGEDASRTPVDNLIYVFEGPVPYVDAVSIPDTTGTATPTEVTKLVRALRERFPETEIEGHFHNDLLRSLQNAEAGIEAGINLIDTSIGGLGERLGITDMVSLLLIFYLKNKDFVKDYSIGMSYQLNLLVAKITGVDIDLRSIVSKYNRTHMAGVHSAAVLNDRSSYEAFAEALEAFGVTQTELPLGELSGGNLTRQSLRELGYDLTLAQAKTFSAILKSRRPEIVHKAIHEAMIKLAEEMNLPRNGVIYP